MAENPPFAPDVITNPELEEGIKNGRISTFTIDERNLTFYQEAAIKTGFEVEIIAKPGQHYITKQITSPTGRSNAIRRRPSAIGKENKTSTITPVKSQLPVRESYVAISLKRPEGAINDMAFHIARQKIQPI